MVPAFAVILTVVALSSIGLPGTNGFIGEFMILSGTFVSGQLSVWEKVFALFAATGVTDGDMLQGVRYRRSGATTGAWPGFQTFCGWKGSGVDSKGGLGPWTIPRYMREQSLTIMQR